MSEQPTTTGRAIHIVDNPAQGRVDPNLVPDDVKTDVEDAYQALQGRAKSSAMITFTDKSELTAFVKQARTYCENRTNDEGLSAPLAFRKSPRKGSPDNVLYFTVRDPETGTASE